MRLESKGSVLKAQNLQARGKWQCQIWSRHRSCFQTWVFFALVWVCSAGRAAKTTALLSAMSTIQEVRLLPSGKVLAFISDSHFSSALTYFHSEAGNFLHMDIGLKRGTSLVRAAQHQL